MVAANVKQFSVSMTADPLDDTHIDGTGWRDRVLGMVDVSVTLSTTKLDEAAFPARAANAYERFVTALKERRSIFVDLQTSRVAPYDRIRGWFVMADDSQQGSADELEMENVTLNLDGNAQPGANFDWQTIT